MKKMTTGALMCCFLTGATSLTVEAREPKIVVGIMVDQLRTDYLEQLLPYFGETGFNRLIRDGVYLPDVDFKGSVSDAASGTAVVYTGAWPTFTGVASAEVLDLNLKKNVPTLAADPSKLRIDYSPANLRLSTVSDEYFINHGNLAKIYSIAGDPQMAVVAAGHAGNSAIWFDETTGRWSTPTYYGSLPPVVANQARTSPISSRVASTSWRPLRAASHYNLNTTGGGDFSYSFPGGNREAYGKFKQSAPFNKEVTDLAIELMKTMHPQGSSSHPGMLNISYTLAPINFDIDDDSRPELIDAYVQLDADLGRLLSAIDRDFGAGNAVVFLSSTGYAKEPHIRITEAKIPTGEITLKKAESLLNAYLSASFGNGDYVALIRDGKLYLDSKLISSKGLDIKRLRNEAKDFLLKMGGVSEIFTIDEVLHSDNRRLHNLSLGIDPKKAPDLLLFFTPGWTVVDDNSYPSTKQEVRMATHPTPAFIIAPEVKPQKISSPVDATSLAPTVSSILRIRPPNGSSAKPLVLN